jgi:hypothetical protein
VLGEEENTARACQQRYPRCCLMYIHVSVCILRSTYMLLHPLLNCVSSWQQNLLLLVQKFSCVLSVSAGWC